MILAMLLIDVFGLISVVCQEYNNIFQKSFALTSITLRDYFFLPTSLPSVLILRWKISLIFHPEGLSEINMATADC